MKMMVMGGTRFGGTPLLMTDAIEILLRDWTLGSGLAQNDRAYRATAPADGIRTIVKGCESRSEPTASA